MRSLNGSERNKIFKIMYDDRNMIDLFPDLEEILKDLNFIFKEYYDILTLIKTFGSNPIDLGRLEERLRNWLSYYISENALLPRIVILNINCY